MAKPVIFVIGASGNIGAATVQALSSKHADKFDIRAGVRNPDKADKLKLPGVTVVKAEMGTADLKETLKGVDALYIVTPGVENRASLTVATAEAAKEAGVKFLLVVSVLTYQLTDTIFGRQLTEIEGKVSALGVPHCFLRLPLFVDNYWAFKDGIKGSSTIYSPADPEKPYTPVTVVDAGKAGAVILADYSKHVGKGYRVVSERQTYTQVAAAFTAALGREISYVRVPYDAAKQAFMGMGMPEWQTDGVLELYHLIDNGSPVINVDDLGDFKAITGEEPTDLKTWLAPIAENFK